MNPVPQMSGNSDDLLLCLYAFTVATVYVYFSEISANLAKALAKCLHSPLIGQALQFGLLFVQKTCVQINK